MKRNVSIGIDIGTRSTKVVILQNGNGVKEEAVKQSLAPRIIATGLSDTKGMRHGYITHLGEAIKSVRGAVRMAEKTLGTKMPKACISVGGISLSGNVFISSTAIAKNGEVSAQDVAKVLEPAHTDMPQSFALNRRIINTFPLSYKIDGRTVPGNPHGLKGAKLESRSLYVTCLTHHINDLIAAVEEADIDVEDIIAGPIASANVVLSKAEKIAGVVLVDIGAETVSMVVYENGLPISLEVFQIGSNDITNDIALGMKINLDQAEAMKKESGKGEHSKRKLDEIIHARLSDIFELIEGHLKKIGKSGLLPAGIVLCGGGSELNNIEEIAKHYLKLPARRVENKLDGNMRGQIKSGEWGGAYGAALFSLSPSEEDGGEEPSGPGFFAWIKQFLP